LVDSFIKYRGKLTAPLMSYIQKNHGNHGKKSADKKFKSLNSLDIDELLSDAQTKALATENIDIPPLKDDFENQIFERFGSEPSRNKSENKIQTDNNIKTDLKQEYKPISQSENNAIPLVSETNDKSEDHKEFGESHDNGMKTLLILDEFPSILGVDKNVYGPVSPQDLITIPEPNARILVKNKKGIFIQKYK
jgi:DNA replication factor GINS